MHANVETLKERRAALEQDMGALLTQHEQLTRQQPWAQQHVSTSAPLRVSASLPAATRRPPQCSHGLQSAIWKWIGKALLRLHFVLKVLKPYMYPKPKINILKKPSLKTELCVHCCYTGGGALHSFHHHPDARSCGQVWEKGDSAGAGPALKTHAGALRPATAPAHQ